MSFSFMVPPQSKKSIDKIAEKYLSLTHPEVLIKAQPLNVERLLTVSLGKTHDVAVHIVPNLRTNVEAETELWQREILIPEETLRKINAGDGRARFTGCHEAMHVILHATHVQYVSAARAEFIPAYRDPEWQADYGAAAFLMPRTTFIPFCNERVLRGMNLTEIVEDIRDTYQVSATAAGIRFDTLIGRSKLKTP